MESLQNTMPGYRMNDYLLVVPPNEDLRGKIISVRKQFNEKYQPAMPLTGRPHMALVHFVAYSMMEEKIMHRFHRIALGTTPFKIELKNFASFPTHTIYINVATKIPVQNLVKELKSVQKLMKADKEHDPHFIAEPFIPIARKLLPWQFEKGWLEYSHAHFSSKIIADGMLLLKRPLGDKGYQVVQRFEFLNMPVTTRQGELFF